MNEAGDTARGEPEVAAFEADLVALQAGSREVDAARFAARFRALARRLGLARHRGYRVASVARLNGLALRGHAQLYRRAARHRSFPALVLEALAAVPRAVRRHRAAVLVSAGLFYGTFLASCAFVVGDGERVYAFMGPAEVQQLESMYGPLGGGALSERGASGDAAMFGFYVFNNVGIAFRTFATGALGGVGSLFFLIYNGLSLGAATGHLHNVDMTGRFFPFVIGHGALELNGIVLSGAAGCALGWSLLSPGRRRRSAAFVAAARSVLPLIYGFTAMLLLAAVLEAFWSSTEGLGVAPRYAVGGALWIVVLSYLASGGQPRAR